MERRKERSAELLSWGKKLYCLPYRSINHKNMDRDITKRYSNGEVTIVWKPASCIHSTICWKAATGLPDVFNPKERPWIKPEGKESTALVEQVKKCPSGALSYYYNKEEAANEAAT